MNRLNKIKRKLLVFTISIAAIFLSFKLMDDPRITKIINQLNTFSGRSKLQKVYLKTDKDKYITGETIWMNAFILDAATLKSSSSSNEVFIDLVDRENKVRESVIIQNNDGNSNGYILLNDSLPDGNYQLVAYTNWMKNFDENYFFSKTVEIVNPDYKNFINSTSLNEIKKHNKDIQTSEKEKIVQFFPEGGNMVNGLESRIAFKATNKNGYGMDVNGGIYDETGTKILNFASKHLGMGAFSFIPDSKHKYYAKVLFADGETHKFELPSVLAKGYVIMANAIVGNQVRLNIQTNVDTDTELIIVGQSRNEIRYMSKAQYKGTPITLNIPKKTFPSGIAQITLFNDNGEPVCERLVFIQPKDNESKTNLEVEKQMEGDYLIYSLKLKQTNGATGGGKLSLSISENRKTDKRWSQNILSNLLLTSDLKGRVENAADYFDASNPETAMNLDYVMMVNGWRRFVWKEILAGQFQTLLFPMSEGVTANEISTTPVQPLALNMNEKAFPVVLNEIFDNKLLKKNSKQSGTRNSTPEVKGNVAVVDHQKMAMYADMVQYLKGKVAGVTVTDNGITIRGAASFMAGTDPLILLDNLPISFNDLKQISPIDVASVEVLKGPDASIYGVRGANGVVIVHMRTAKEYRNINPNEEQPSKPLRILSFQKAREFYVPAYETWNNKPQDYNVPRSVYWRPLITIDSTGVATVKIKKRPEVTDFITSIEGIATDGSVLYYQSAN